MKLFIVVMTPKKKPIILKVHAADKADARNRAEAAGFPREKYETEVYEGFEDAD